MAWWERGRVPRGWPSLVLVCHSPAVSLRPGTGRPWALPGTQRGIEGHSRALSPVPATKGPVALCRLPWPSAASTAAGDQGHPWEPWHPRDVGHPRDRTAPATALGPWGATGVPTRMLLPHGGHGAGQSSCKIPIKRGKTSSLEPPKLKAGSWDGNPFSLLLDEVTGAHHCCPTGSHSHTASVGSLDQHSLVGLGDVPRATKEGGPPSPLPPECCLPFAKPFPPGGCAGPWHHPGAGSQGVLGGRAGRARAFKGGGCHSQSPFLCWRAGQAPRGGIQGVGPPGSTEAAEPERRSGGAEPDQHHG